MKLIGIVPRHTTGRYRDNATALPIVPIYLLHMYLESESTEDYIWEEINDLTWTEAQI